MVAMLPIHRSSHVLSLGQMPGWATAVHVGDKEEALGSWLWPDPAVAFADIWVLNQQMRYSLSLSLSLCLSISLTMALTLK